MPCLATVLCREKKNQPKFYSFVLWNWPSCAWLDACVSLLHVILIFLFIYLFLYLFIYFLFCFSPFIAFLFHDTSSVAGSGVVRTLKAENRQQGRLPSQDGGAPSSRFDEDEFGSSVDPRELEAQKRAAWRKARCV